MNELTIRRIAMSFITDNTRYIADKDADERIITLAYVRGVTEMANEMIATLEMEGDAE